MASRLIHLATANEICKHTQINCIDRFNLGIILPDAYNRNATASGNSHFKYTVGDKKTYGLKRFRETYENRINTDSLYLGYYLHLIQDTVFRHFVYDLHGWNPYPKENVERLHNDYKLLNGYISEKYAISDSLTVYGDISREPIFDIYLFDTQQLLADFRADFEPYNDGAAFFFTREMADEYISLATDKCVEEIEALRNGSTVFDELEWAWEKKGKKR